MKIRTDYVSNSSSSSFIVSVKYPLKEFIKDVVKGCSDHPDWDAPSEYIERINDMNARNLDYCLNTFELLFLGTLTTNSVKHTISGKDNCKDYLDNQQRIIKLYGSNPEWMDDKIISQSEDEIIIEHPVKSYNVVVSNNVMEYDFLRSSSFGETPYYSSDEDRKNRVDKILKIAIDSSDYSTTPRKIEHIGLYEITMNTIMNTEDLVKEGKIVKLDGWCKDLDALKKRIENGDKLFGIELSQGGDGMSSGTIYGMSGWDSNFNKFADVEVLHSECC